jgi:hypothetical protein
VRRTISDTRFFPRPRRLVIDDRATVSHTTPDRIAFFFGVAQAKAPIER